MTQGRFYRCLRFKYKKSRFFFRYPFQYDNDPDFLKRLGEFIAHDLSVNVYDDMSTSSNTFFIDLVDNNLQFVDKKTFHSNDSEARKKLRLDEEGDD